MFKLIYKIRKPLFLFPFTLFLTLLLYLPWVSAKQPPKPQDWQMNGIVAAIDFEQWRFLTYFLSGGTDEVKTLLKWLGNPKSLPTQLNYAEGKQTLELFANIWTETQQLKPLQKDLADKIAQVVQRVSWKPEDISLLETHYNNLKNAGYSQADTVRSVIELGRDTSGGRSDRK